MPDRCLMEEPLQFGAGGRLFGILTAPSMPPGGAPERPLFVFLNAGSLHRVGPFRLHVRLARELSRMGFSSLRVDLAGTGDSPTLPGLTNEQAVAADFVDIMAALESRLGRAPLVLAGLCSGADNTIRLTLEEPRVVGMVLLDPICFLDRGFALRVAAARYLSPTRQIAWLQRRGKALMSPRAQVEETVESVDPLTFRDLPTQEQMRAAFAAVRERGGRVLSVFTDYARGYYNISGQLGRVLDVDGYGQFCTELYWPQVDHTYKLELHRQRLIEEIKTWASPCLRL